MNRIRFHIQINGIVQGVGFRPFLHRLMKQHRLSGWIRNTSAGVELETESRKAEIERFISAVQTEAPCLARIDSISLAELNGLKDYQDIRILESDVQNKRDTLISPDVAVCRDCLRELMDPLDRRYRYPFINCTNCGPRFSIIRDVPYDRSSTTMSDFQMCPDCAAEYKDIENRRYHAQPDCCPVCGPELIYADAKGQPSKDDPILLAAEQLRSGKIIAVKGLGGIHLACRCDDAPAVMELRHRKHRDEKPFALMCRNMESVQNYCLVNPDEERMLTGHIRPIVLLKKHATEAFPWLSKNAYLGIMLPYTPLHHLLLEAAVCDLVMTSANISDLPIIIDNADALQKLHGIADGFLLNNRGIENRCDDSLLWMIGSQPYFVRRSRGFAPEPLHLQNADRQVLACGAEQKASFCVSRGEQVFQSSHIGDLKNAETLEHYERQISLFERLFNVRPQRIVCDLHPDYLSTDYAHRRAAKENIPLLHVQHHHAHMAACMADNELDKPCIGIVWDGTGFGPDGSVWGSEFLIGGYSGFVRAGTLRPVKLAGGDRAIREIWRIGVALLLDAGIDPAEFFPEENCAKIQTLLGMNLNCPFSHGMGRLFDGVSAIAGICKHAGYEGQGAILLETAACENHPGEYPFDIVHENHMHVIDTRPMIAAICNDLRMQVSAAYISARFMNTLVAAALEICRRIRKEHNLNCTVLSGGVFQNMYLLHHLTKALEEDGFEVFRHCKVSTNDEGISFGQIAIAERGGGIDVFGGTAENY